MVWFVRRRLFFVMSTYTVDSQKLMATKDRFCEKVNKVQEVDSEHDQCLCTSEESI